MGVRIFGIAGSSNAAEDFRLAASGLFVPASQISDRTGVTSTPVLTGTGSLTCTIGPFACVVAGTLNSFQAAYWATLDSATTVTITAGATQARIDLISLQIQDNAYDGGGVEAGRILYTAGTPGSGVPPTAPADSISLFTVAVPANATTINFSTAATAVFPYTAAAGGIVPARSAADKPAVASAVQYRHRLDVTAGTGAAPLEWSTDGATYTPVYDPNAAYGSWVNLGAGTGFSFGFIGLSGLQPAYRTTPGGHVELRGGVSNSGAVASGSQILTGLPAPASGGRILAPANTSGMYMQIAQGATVATIQTPTGGSFPFGSNVSFDGLSYMP